MGVISLSTAFSYQYALSEAVKGRGTTLSFRGRELIQQQAGGRLHNKLGLIWMDQGQFSEHPLSRQVQMIDEDLGR
jgi:hypothetical protein